MAKGIAPADGSGKGIRVTFVGLNEGEAPPKVALYSLDADGKAKKLATASQGLIPHPPARLTGRVAIGPDVANPAEIPPDQLLVYRAADVADVWAGEGLVLPRARWDLVLPRFQCVSGTVRKCRPWWWDDIVTKVQTPVKGLKYSKLLSIRDQAVSRINAAVLEGSRYYPWRCVPICEGRVDVYEKQCCCEIIVIADVLDRLRKLLEQVPVHWPPIPQPDPPPFRTLARKAAAGSVRAEADPSAAPPQRLFEAYGDLMRLPPVEAERYIRAREWLYPFCCDCRVRYVGTTSIQPDGSFDLCYPRRRPPFNCSLTFAYVVRQFINGAWRIVYNGLAAHAWFGGAEDANIRVDNPIAVPCDDFDNPPPPNGTGLPFIMLDHVGAYGTFHYQYPPQTGDHRFGPIAGGAGLYNVGGVPDCPWAETLNLVLFASSDLQPIVFFYRLSTVKVDASGSPIGAPAPLTRSVDWTWRDSTTVFGTENLGPKSVGAENNLYKIPYPRSVAPAIYHDWEPGQAHQRWDTKLFESGKYMLILEVFDKNGARIRPSSSAGGPGAARNFAFLRWVNPAGTAQVPFADCAHVFWTDREAVHGDIVDLRKNGQGNTAECQYMSGSADDLFSIGYQAFHDHGVSDSDSFMRYHAISWQRGLNGATGSLAPEVSATTDAGEYGTIAQSGSASFGSLLGANAKCTFSVTLEVYSKHFNGIGFIGGSAYDYRETASFAVEVAP